MWVGDGKGGGAAVGFGVEEGGDAAVGGGDERRFFVCDLGGGCGRGGVRGGVGVAHSGC